MWEYMVVSLLTSEDTQKIFNSLGRRRWELAGIEGPKRYIFKRRKLKAR